MTEKRFKNVGKDIFQYGEWYCSANGEHCADVIATALNELIEENEQLKVKKQKQENLINSQNKCIEGLENWFDKWGFDTINYQILDQIMEHFFEGDINEIR